MRFCLYALAVSTSLITSLTWARDPKPLELKVSDGFALSPGKAAAPMRGYSSFHDGIFVAGTAEDEKGKKWWIVQQAPWSGSKWTTHKFLLDGGKSAEPKSILGDDLGHTYVAGDASDENNTHHLILRRGTHSKTGVMEWQTLIDRKDTSEASWSTPYQALSPSNGHAILWLVKKTPKNTTAPASFYLYQIKEGGNSWFLSELALKTPGFDFRVGAIAADPQGNLLVTGLLKSLDPTVKSTWWSIWRYDHEQGSWQETEHFKDSRFEGSWGFRLTIGNRGEVQAMGFSYNSPGLSNYRWQVLTSIDGGRKFSITDDFLYREKFESACEGMKRDPRGNTWVIGSANNQLIARSNEGRDHTWITRVDHLPLPDEESLWGQDLVWGDRGRPYFIAAGCAKNALPKADCISTWRVLTPQ